MRLSSRLLVLLALACATGCSSATPAEATRGPFTILLFNDSPFTLTDIQVTTADGITIRQAQLAHGDMSAPHYVTAMHQDPSVTLTVNGTSLSSIPVEGFSAGFNPSVAPGTYIVNLSVPSTQPLRLVVSVVHPIVDPKP